MLRDEQKAQAALMKDKPFSERIRYFFFYHKFLVAAVLIGTVLISWVVYSISTFSLENLYIMITDQQGDSLNTEILTDTWNQTCKDTSTETLPIVYTTDLELADLTLNNITVEDLQKVLALYNAHTLDVMIAPEAVFQNYGKEGMFQSLLDVLPEEKSRELSEKNLLYSVTVKETGKTVPVAVRISDFSLTEKAGFVIDDICIGLTVKQSHPEHALRFFQMFLDTQKNS